MKDEMTQAAHHVTFGDTTVDGGKSEILDYSELSLVKVGKKYIHSSFVLKFTK